MTHLFPPVRYFLAVMLLFAGLTSWIKEDLSDCPPPAPPAPVEVEIRIRPDFIPYSEETGEGFEASELKTLTVFAFDSHGRFVTKATDNAPRLFWGYWSSNESSFSNHSYAERLYRL